MTRTNFYITLLFLSVAAVGMSSCNKYLEERPSKNSTLPVTNTDQLNSLLNSYVSFYTENNGTAIYSSDDYGLNKQIYDARPGTFTFIPGLLYSFWDTEFLPNNTDAFWSTEWRKIFTANMALNSLETITGSEQDKAILKADAHFIRAYSYWVLANTYCLPYTDANRNEPGLTIKVATSFDEILERAPLEKVYELIEADLAEALKTPLSLVQNNRPRHWRANKAAVNGFAARYYLNRNNYTEALKYANDALADYNVLVDYNTEMRYGRPGSVNITTPDGPETFTLEFPYTHDNQIDLTDMFAWKEFMYFRMLNHGSWWYIPSQELVDLYDKDHDLRYKYHMVEGYSYDRGMTNPAFSYPGYVFFFKDRIPSGPTVAEMHLIKAECEARGGNFEQGLTTANTLRASRMMPGDWVEMTAADQAEAVRKILEERRRELPFTQRWFDLRRYNNNEDPADDVVVTKEFYPLSIAGAVSSEPARTYTLEKNSRRYAAPIPLTEVISSEGQIQQNQY